ncbi:hypothetical protein RMATCC62417_11600 [Rhizopus microsporus]|nr:hypothetical protein RMATCC62417_11600 [Rhizopus microsporus]
MLPRSVMMDAEKHAKRAPGEIREYLEKNLPKRNVALWVDFVSAIFDHAVKNLLDNPALANTYMDQNLFSKITADDDARIQDDYRTCPSSISKIIRKDLPAEAKCIINQKLGDSIIKISNYISQFASVVYMMMTELRNCVFDMEHSTGKLKLTRSSGFNIASILPFDFACRYDRPIQFTASAVSEDFLDSSVFTQDFNLLFGGQHLGLIHSYYFGTKGSRADTLARHPVQMTLFDILQSSSILPNSFNDPGLSSAELRNVRVQYATNLETMWSNKKNHQQAS